MVTVLTQNNCSACVQTKSMLDTLGIEYLEKDISEQEAWDYLVKSGYKSVPVVVVSDLLSWSGHQPSRIMALKK